MSQFDFRDKQLFVDKFGDDVFAVGGVVRDRFLDRDFPSAVDLLVIHHPVEKILKILQPIGKADLVGKSFGIIKFNFQGKTYDIALPRRDTPRQVEIRGHKDFLIQADPDLPIEKDLNRRDFRCNSIAIRLKDDKVIDPFNGLEDIRSRILRLTNPKAFPEDPLRVLRAARFASVLKFSIDPEIYTISKDIDLSGLSVERIVEEFFRIMLDSETPSIGLEELFKLSALEQLFSEVYRLTLVIQDSLFHPEKDEYGHHTVWHHTKITVDQAKRLAVSQKLPLQEELALLLAALFHDVGKAATTRWKYKKDRMVISSEGHDTAGEKITKNFFNRYKIHSWNGYDLRKTVLSLVRCHHRSSELWQNRDVVTKKAFNRLAADVNGDIELLIYLDAADRAGRSEKPVSGLDKESLWLIKKFEEWNVSRETIKPIIMGRDLIELGITPGPHMGKILKRLYELQLDNEFEDKTKGLQIAKKIIAEDNE